MKKFFSVLLTVLTAAVLAFSLTACEKHTHDYAAVWSKDATYHWHAATCEHTDEVKDKAEHSFYSGLCTVCGYQTADYPKGLRFKFNPDENAYCVTGLGTCKDTNLVIPFEFQGLPVIGIGDKAFYVNTSLKSITLPRQRDEYRRLCVLRLYFSFRHKHSRRCDEYRRLCVLQLHFPDKYNNPRRRD